MGDQREGPSNVQEHSRFQIRLFLTWWLNRISQSESKICWISKLMVFCIQLEAYRGSTIQPNESSASVIFGKFDCLDDILDFQLTRKGNLSTFFWHHSSFSLFSFLAHKILNFCTESVVFSSRKTWLKQIEVRQKLQQRFFSNIFGLASLWIHHKSDAVTETLSPLGGWTSYKIPVPPKSREISTVSKNFANRNYFS